MLVKAVTEVYPSASYKSRNRRRIENAYGDAIRFYTLTDHRNPLLRTRALELDRREGARHRRGAVFHFPDLGQELDPANLQHRPWPHPCCPEVVSDESFLDLMAAARAALVPRMSRLATILGLGRRGPAVPEEEFGSDAGETVAELAASFGDQSLGATRDGRTCTPIHAEPLPLAELMEGLHRESARAMQRPAFVRGTAPVVSDAATRGFVLGTARDRGFEHVAKFLLLLGHDGDARGAGPVPACRCRSDGHRPGSRRNRQRRASVRHTESSRNSVTGWRPARLYARGGDAAAAAMLRAAFGEERARAWRTRLAAPATPVPCRDAAEERLPE